MKPPKAKKFLRDLHNLMKQYGFEDLWISADETVVFDAGECRLIIGHFSGCSGTAKVELTNFGPEKRVNTIKLDCEEVFEDD